MMQVCITLKNGEEKSYKREYLTAQPEGTFFVVCFPHENYRSLTPISDIKEITIRECEE